MKRLDQATAIPCTLLIATLLGAPLQSAAAAEDKNFDIGVGVGGEYDSNITVDAQDLTTNEGDVAALLEAALSFKPIQNGNSSLEIGYDFFQSLHDDLSDFDLQIHGLSLTGSTKIGGVDASANYRFSHILLGGDSFLDIHSVRPTLGFYVRQDVYVSAAYEYQWRDYDDLAPRDSHQHNVGGTGYYFFAPKSNVHAGYKLLREKADGPEFTYWGHYFDVGIKAPIAVGDVSPVFRADYRYSVKNFSHLTPSIGEERLDKRHHFRASLEMPIVGNVSLKPQYEFINTISNLASVDYHQHIVSLMLNWRM